MNRIQIPAVNLTGCMLVASPDWQDPLLGRSVCLVVHHQPDRAVGVLLNKTLSLDAKEILKQFGTSPDGLRAEMYLGGLQAGPVVAMHRRKELAEFTPAEGVYFAAQVDHLKQLVTDTSACCRIFVGQAVWDQDQLNQQFSRGCWLPLAVDSKIAFRAADEMWPAAMREVGNHLVECLVGSVAPSTLESN